MTPCIPCILGSFIELGFLCEKQASLCSDSTKLTRLLGWDIRWLHNVQSKFDYPDFFSGPNFVMDIY